MAIADDILNNPTWASSFNFDVPAAEVDVTTAGGGDLFGDFDIDLKGIGSLASVLGSLWSAKNQSDYQDELLKREDARIARDRERQDKFDDGMAKAYA